MIIFLVSKYWGGTLKLVTTYPRYAEPGFNEPPGMLKLVSTYPRGEVT